MFFTYSIMHGKLPEEVKLLTMQGMGREDPKGGYTSETVVYSEFHQKVV